MISIKHTKILMHALPYAVKQSKTIWLIQQGHVGPRPLCFYNDRDWREHLMLHAASGEKITRRQDTGTYVDKKRQSRSVRTVFSGADYCAECDESSGYPARMTRAGRCAKATKTTGPQMLKTLCSIVTDLAAVTKSPQISIVPNTTGGMSIIAAWGVDENVHELAMHYTEKEIEAATGEQIAESLARMAAEVREEAVQSMVKDMSPQEMQSRLLTAARRSPTHQAADILAAITKNAAAAGVQGV